MLLFGPLTVPCPPAAQAAPRRAQEAPRREAQRGGGRVRPPAGAALQGEHREEEGGAPPAQLDARLAELAGGQEGRQVIVPSSRQHTIHGHGVTPALRVCSDGTVGEWEVREDEPIGDTE